MLNRVVVYPLLGYYLEHYITEDQYNRRNDGKMLLAMLAVLAIFAIMTVLRALPYEEFTIYDKGLYTCSLTMVLDVGVYYFAKRFCLAKGWDKRQGQKATIGRKIITSLGSATFGIYLVEQPVREHTTKICDSLKEIIGAFPACIVWVLCVAVIAYGVTMVMKCIPGLRRLL
jgi:peptidoglycan/LPS O-acetylase OafA/YrhL